MSQGSLVIPNTGTLPGLTLVNLVNAAIDRLSTLSSGATDPASLSGGVQPFSFWLDTSVTPNMLRQRNSANTAWVIIGTINGGASDSQTQQFTAFTTGGSATAYTLTPSPAITALAVNQRFTATFHASNTSATPTLAISGLTAKNLKVYDSTGAKQSPAVGALVTGMVSDIIYDGTDYVVLDQLPVPSSPIQSSVRQTVLNGAVDSSGFPAFGGATGATTVTQSTTLTVTAANGTANRVGTITNASWTGLSTSGTMYLGLTVNADGTCTPFSTTLQPVYQWGGTYGVASGQRTFNIQQMQMQVGNGSTASQSYDVFVGEVTVAGGVVTAISWYALMGRYSNTQATLAAASTYTFSHNIGVPQVQINSWLDCVTAELGFSVGDRIYNFNDGSARGAGTSVGFPARTTYKTIIYTSGSYPISVNGSGNGTMANWKLGFIVTRGW